MNFRWNCFYCSSRLYLLLSDMTILGSSALLIFIYFIAELFFSLTCTFSSDDVVVTLWDVFISLDILATLLVYTVVEADVSKWKINLRLFLRLFLRVPLLHLIKNKLQTKKTYSWKYPKMKNSNIMIGTDLDLWNRQTLTFCLNILAWFCQHLTYRTLSVPPLLCKTTQKIPRIGYF